MRYQDTSDQKWRSVVFRSESAIGVDAQSSAHTLLGATVIQPQTLHGDEIGVFGDGPSGR